MSQMFVTGLFLNHLVIQSEAMFRSDILHCHKVAGEVLDIVFILSDVGSNEQKLSEVTVKTDLMVRSTSVQ